MERETGIEPATNSLEGCDSTTELLPPFDSLRSLRASLRARRLACPRTLATSRFGGRARHISHDPLTSRNSIQAEKRSALSPVSRGAARKRGLPPNKQRHQPSQSRRASLHTRGGAKEGWWGGEGSNLRSPKAAGLQPAAIDRSATSPTYITRAARSGHDRSGSQRFYPLRPWAKALKPSHVMESACPMYP